ncbi:hypothetical protein ACQKGL_23540 [Ensifer adhaerens]|uniref:hypothetical protein n=1 Tax=Ensifer adhaerens TaxID=106592 RepID=UPI003CFC1803
MRHFAGGSVATAIPASTAITVAIAGFKDEAFSTRGRLSDHFGFADAAADPGKDDQSGHGGANDENSEREEYFAHVFASSPNVTLEGTLR